jgi:hypothetical protein
MFEIDSKPEISRVEIANGNFCLVVDNFLRDPQEAVTYARAKAEDFELQESGYPGMLLLADASKLADIYSFVRRNLSREMGFCRGGIKLSTFFSMVTLSPEELNWAQRSCHTDPQTDVGRANFAGLLYLFKDRRLGGTGFYQFRNRATLERATAIGASDPAGALHYLQKHIPMYREPPRYLTESCEVAELLTIIPAQFNRLIFYSGDIPHSAYIEEPELLSDDVDVGRLTLNLFASVVPR